MQRMSAKSWATMLVAVALACGGDGDSTSSSAGAGEAGASETDAGDSAESEGSGGPGSDDGTSGEESSSGGPDPTDGDEPHGEGMCGGGFGDPNGLGHIPPCPSDPITFHQRYLATRADYYHDGDHVFEPKVVQWDDTLAALAQEYAEAYADGMPPDGMQVDTPVDEFEPYWDGTYAGHRAIAGSETPTSCTCSPPDLFGGSEAMVFYNNSSAYFREGVVRMNEVYRMGIGHVAPGDGTHYWTLLFAPE